MSPVVHVVVFSELTPRARAQYTRFLLENNVQFAKRPSDGRHVANVRLQARSSTAVHNEWSVSTGSPQRTSLTPSSPRRQQVTTNPPDDDDEDSDDEREESPTDSNDEETTENSIPSRFRPFAAFIHEVNRHMLSRSCMSTYVTSESKLLRLINDIYDACADDTLSTAAMSADDQPPHTFFAALVHVYLKSRFGIRSLVEQQALELLEGLQAHKARLDVEHFTLFLSGHYDATMLAFFLKARDAAQEAISSSSALFRPTSAASARRRRSDVDPTRRCQRRPSKSTTALVWLSKRQIECAAQKAFGPKNDDAYLQFAHQVRSYLATRDSPRAMQELLELQEFLSLALRTHLELKHSPTPERTGSLSSTASGHQAHDGQDTANISPSPSPLPPPPLPRAFGSTVQAASAKSISTRADVTAPSEDRRQLHDRPAPVQPYTSKQIPSSETTTRKPPADPDDDVQTRLSSLMARMQQRRSDQ